MYGVVINYYATCIKVISLHSKAYIAYLYIKVSH